MNESIVKLVFKTVLAGSGFAQMDAQSSELMKKMSKMSQGVQILGRAFGDMGGMVGQSLGMFMQGGIWGAAATIASTAVSKCVGWFKEWNKLQEDAKLAAKGLSREYDLLGRIAEGYRRRVEGWKKAQAEADRAEKEAADKAKAASERLAESQKEAVRFAQAYYALQDKINIESQKAGLNSEDEIVRLRTKVKLMLDEAKANVADRQRGVATAKASGNLNAVDLANKELELAVVSQKNVVAEAKKMVAEYKKAAAINAEENDKEMVRMMREDFLAAKREKAVKAEGEVRKRYGEAVKRIEEEIAKNRKEAADLEANAQRARGVTFGDWERGERNIARDKRAEERHQRNRENAVDDEIARIEKTNPRTRTQWQRERLSRLREWKADQNPENNPAQKAVKQLEEKRDKLLEAQNKKLDEIKKVLEEVSSL